MKKTTVLLILAISWTLASAEETALIRYEFAPGEVSKACDDSMASAKKRLDELVTKKPKDPLLALEQIFADFGDESTPLTFLYNVTTNKKISEESSNCEQRLGQFTVEILSRRDLYQLISGLKPKDPVEKRLLKVTMDAFEANGLRLSDENLAKVKALNQELSKLENQFSVNLNNDTSMVVFEPKELDGVTPDFMGRLKKRPDGKVEVTTKSPDAIPVLENAKSPETRKKMLIAYQTRGGDANLKLLQQATSLRAQAAKILGFQTWADFKLTTRMAKTKKTVWNFLNGIKGKLAAKNKSDFAALLKFKKESDPSAEEVYQWDVNYLSYQLQKRDYNLDDEKIREYFPSEHVIAEMFKIYSRMLGIRFEEIKEAKVWAPNVKLFKVIDAKTNRLIGHFYADFYPREGKYGHAAAFTLIHGRKLSSGEYQKPVSAIVANFTPPTADKPSLMTHDEVETVFHEFGHIVHQVLTTAPYASLSGTSVPTDFVEAPSQMLENWVWDEKILAEVSGHYKDLNKKLPPALLKQMLRARDFNQGIRYTRQLLFGIYDMTLHSGNGSLDPMTTFNKLYSEIIGLKSLPELKFPATFGHLMGGYDSGYYGYLWSEVYAQDMFSRFPKGDIGSAKVGMLYRKNILEQGNSREPMDSLKQFLGRMPSNAAFFKRLHIK